MLEGEVSGVYEKAINRREEVVKSLKVRLSELRFPRGREELKVSSRLERLIGAVKIGEIKAEQIGATLDSFEILYHNYPEPLDPGDNVSFWCTIYQGRKLLVQNIYVGPSIRGKGLGKQIVLMLEALALENDCQRSVLWHVDTPASFRMSEGLGYQDIYDGKQLGVNRYKTLRRAVLHEAHLPQS